MSEQPTDPGQAPAAPRRKSLLHDLKTPLNQIIGYAEMLEEEAQDDGRSADVETLLKISKAGRRLSEMLEVAFDPARAQARVEAAAGQAAGALEAQKPSSEEPTARGVGRLLVVDDNEMNRDMLSRRLKGRGYDVQVAEGGREALEKLQGEAYDLVLLDVMMPEVSGLDVLAEVRKHRSRGELPDHHGHRQGPERGHRHGPQARGQRLRHQAARLPGGLLARTEAALNLKRAMDEIRRLNDGLERAQPLHPQDLRPLPQRRDRGRAAGERRGARTGRAEARGHDPDVGPARLHVDGRAALARGRRAHAQRLPGRDGRGHREAPRHHRRVHRRRHPGAVRRADRAPRRCRPRRGLRARDATGHDRRQRPLPPPGAARGRDGHRAQHGRGRGRQHRLREAHEVRRGGQPRQPDLAHRVLHGRRPGHDLRPHARGGRPGDRDRTVAADRGQGLQAADHRSRPARHRRALRPGAAGAAPRVPHRCAAPCPWPAP